MFANCVNLLEFPKSLKLKNARLYQNMFANCHSLSGDINEFVNNFENNPIAGTTLVSNTTDNNVIEYFWPNIKGLFQNCYNLRGYAQPNIFWFNQNNWYYNKMTFKNCYNLDNYNNIPYFWSGNQNLTNNQDDPGFFGFQVGSIFKLNNNKKLPITENDTILRLIEVTEPITKKCVINVTKITDDEQIIPKIYIFQSVNIYLKNYQWIQKFNYRSVKELKNWPENSYNQNITIEYDSSYGCPVLVFENCIPSFNNVSTTPNLLASVEQYSRLAKSRDGDFENCVNLKRIGENVYFTRN